jgi:putative transposase
MRYADGGGLTEQGRTKREAVRLQAAEWFAQDMPVGTIARRLRVSTNAVYVWRRRWRADGPAALMSKGPGGSACRLDERRQARLVQALEQGPAAHGFDEEDQRWTLARVADLIARLFHTRYTLRGVSYLLHRMGFSPQVPAHRAVERDEEAIATWRREAWQAGKR